jgi:predicted nucleotidyltransferase
VTVNLKLPKDFQEFIQSLQLKRARFLVIGGYAVAYHGHPRFTGDVDFFVECSLENGSRISSAIADFGLASLGLKAEDFSQIGMVVQLGRPPRRIDILTGVDGIDFETAWASRVEVTIDGLVVPFISKEQLILSKRAAGRQKDLDDLRYLEG